jgi:hypothetical protein
MRLEALPMYVWRVAVSRDLVHHRDVVYASDLDGFELSAERSFHRHVDGEPLPPSERATFGVAVDALNVIA